MDKLPFELIAHIAKDVACDRTFVNGQYRHNQPLSGYSCISRSWQSAIESITFNSIVLTSEDLVSGEALRILSQDRRLRYLNGVEVKIEAKDAKPEARQNEQSSKDTATRDVEKDICDPVRQVVRQNLRGKFRTILHLDKCALEDPARSHELPSHQARHHDENQPTTKREPSKTLPSPAQTLRRAIKELFDLLSRVSSRPEPHIWLKLMIRLLHIETPGETDALLHLDPEELPELPAVVACDISGITQSVAYAPCSLLRMTSKMSRVQTVEMYVHVAEDSPIARRGQMRDDTATGLHLMPTSVRSLKVRYNGDELRMDWVGTNRRSEAKLDELSRAILYFPEGRNIENYEAEVSMDWPVLRDFFRSGFHQSLPSGISKYLLDIRGVCLPRNFVESDVHGGQDNRAALKQCQEDMLFDALIFMAKALRRLPQLRWLNINLLIPSPDYLDGCLWSLEYATDGEDATLSVMVETWGLFDMRRQGEAWKLWLDMSRARGKELRVKIMAPVGRSTCYTLESGREGAFDMREVNEE